MSGSEHVNACAVQRFDVPPERVFDAWLDPASIGRWMFGPALRAEEVLGVTVDARVGGAFSFLVRRDGQELDHVGIYEQIERPRRLVFTWGIGEPSSRVIVELLPVGDGCEVTVTHEVDPKWADMVEQIGQTWSQMMKVLAQGLQ